MTLRWMVPFVVVVGLVSTGGCSDDAGLPDARLPTDAAVPGTLSLAWSIAHLGTPLTCATVDAITVSMEIIPDGAAFGVVDSLSCGVGTGESRALAPGKYDVRVTLDGAGGTLAGPQLFLHQDVVSSQATTIGPIAFDVDPHGDLAFHITTPPTGGNCAAAAQMGAAITSTAIVLRDAAGTCVPTTFAIAAGASLPAGNYTSDCAGSVYNACIDADQEVRATAVASGQHSMAITGNVAAAPCWKRISSFRVRAAGQLTTLNPQQLILDGTVANCPM